MDKETLEKIKEKLSLVPNKPGCYQMKNKDGIIIYVGKAKKLKNRLSSYFRGTHYGKTAKLVSEIKDFEYIIVSSETESLIMEINLIKQYDPKYNILLRDDKSYPYIELTNDEVPKLSIVRNLNRKKNKEHLYGPYPNVTAARNTFNLLNRIYPLRKCRTFNKKPCLYYHIGECLGYCTHNVDKVKIDNMKKDIIRFLNGDHSLITKKIREDIIKESEKLNFESAKELKDLLDYINMLNDQFMTLWSSVFYNTNHYGYYLTIVCLVSISYFLTHEHNLKYLVIFCFNFIVLIFNNTFGSYLGVLVGLFFAFAISFKVKKINKQRIFTTLIIIILSTVFVKAVNPLSSGNFTILFQDLINITTESQQSETAGSNRWGLWLYSINKLNKKPSTYLTGYGIEGISDQMQKDTEVNRPHNEFLQQVVFFGLPALILYVVAIFLIYLHGYYNASLLSIATIVALIASFGYLFQSSFGNTMYYTSPFFFCILGMAYDHK